MRLRGAIYGCGMISEFHIRGWLRIPEVEIVALGNRTVERAEMRRRQFLPQAHIYTDLPSLLDGERLDFIDILTAPAGHHADCLLAKQAGVHIFCQKPLCDTMAASQDLVEQMVGYSKVFAVHENHRYRPWFRQIRQRLAASEFGRLHYLRVTHLNKAEPTEAYKNDGETGVFLEYGSHLVDMMRSLLGDPRAVYARSHHLNPHVRGESLTEAVYEYGECTATLEAGWKHAAHTQGELLLLGDRGEAWYQGTLTRGGSGRLRISSGSTTVLDEEICPDDDYAESFYLLEREFTSAMLTGSPIEQTGPEHLRTLQCTFAGYRSACAHAVVEIT